jgi:peptidyl-tRNA hydrolase
MQDPDPVVQYIVVRESLGMSPGKIAAQTGHAVMMLMLAYFEILRNMGGHVPWDRYNHMIVWLGQDYGKVVLRASDVEFEKVKQTFGKDLFLVVDNGHTEVAPKTETVIGLWPMRKSARPKILKRLQRLGAGVEVGHD